MPCSSLVAHLLRTFDERIEARVVLASLKVRSLGCRLLVAVWIAPNTVLYEKGTRLGPFLYALFRQESVAGVLMSLYAIGFSAGRLPMVCRCAMLP